MRFEDRLRPRSLFSLIALLAAVPAVTHPVFAGESSPTDVFPREIHILEIDPHTIGDTKDVVTILEAKIVHEADAE
jgi:hypothetical protein